MTLFDRERFKGPTLYGSSFADSTIGIFGAGAVGRAVAERAIGFAPSKILYIDPIAPAESIAGSDSAITMEPAASVEVLMEECDFLFICTPLNPWTHH